MKRILVTGSKGMLGSAICESLNEKYNIIEGHRDNLDITNFKNVRAFCDGEKPDIVIHTAAFTNAEISETNPETCYSVNFSGTLNLLNAIRPSVKFIYISSTGCYGSYKSSPYCEYDLVKPTTVHHKSKYAAEKVVSEIFSNFLILRTGWLFGGHFQHKKNFVFARYLEACNADTIISDPFQFGNPTSVEDVANQVGIMLEHDLIGTYNVVSNGFCSRFEYVKHIIETFGINCKVIPANQPFKRVAPVSFNETAINYNLNEMGLNSMNDWRKSINAYIDKIKTNVRS